MANERLYIVTYDIAEPKRWQQIFKTMKGYGHWLQLSVFQCRLTARRRAEMAMRLESLGPADPALGGPHPDHRPGSRRQCRSSRRSLGKSYEAPDRRATIV